MDEKTKQQISKENSKISRTSCFGVYAKESKKQQTVSPKKKPTVRER